MGRRGACVICGKSGGLVVFAEGLYRGRLCGCGVVYIDPVPDQRTLAPTVDGHLESYYALPARVRMDWAARFVTGGRFLDIGCGTGALVREAQRRGFDVEAIEPNAACADLVTRRYGIVIERAFVEESALPRERFDVVFHVDLLSHFPDPVRALSAMAALLRPTGTMCFEVGLFGGLAPAWYPWLGRPGFPAHHWFYSEDNIRELLRRAGLDIIAVKTFAIAPCTILSTVLRTVLPQRFQSVPTSATGAPPRGSGIQRLYARLHYGLRYRLGSILTLPGPRTALVAARIVSVRLPRPYFATTS